jgi:threonyl-tRNA synthetase
MLHRALFGSLERFIGILIEHYAGKLPAWLSPTQVAVLSISEKSGEYADKIYKAFRRAGLRVEIDCGREKIGHKIRQHTLKKVPFMAVVGAKEAETGTVNLRHISGESLGEFVLVDVIDYLIKETIVPGRLAVRAKDSNQTEEQ